jgi:hypothetical protein
MDALHPKPVASTPGTQSAAAALPFDTSMAVAGGAETDACLLVLVRALARQAAREAWVRAGHANPNPQEPLP